MDGVNQACYKQKLFDESNDAFTLSLVKHGYQSKESPHGTKIHAAVLMLSPLWHSNDGGLSPRHGPSDPVPNYFQN